MRYFLLIPKIQVHKANAMSSPFTIGVPAMTACLGFMHALQRKLQPKYAKIGLEKLAISYHEFDLQTHQLEFNHHLALTRNSMTFDEKYGDKYPKGTYTSKYDAPLAGRPTIEEAFCHFSASLLIELTGFYFKPAERKQFLESVHQSLGTMKLAGGDILSHQNCEILSFDENKDEDEQLTPILNKLMLGSVLIERTALLQQAKQNGQDSLTALLDYLKVFHTAHYDDKDEVYWQKSRKQGSDGESLGWLVPIAVGFSGISPLGKVDSQRDNETLHRFAECVLTLGEFVMPYRIESLEQMLWQYHFDEENDLYVCRTQS